MFPSSTPSNSLCLLRPPRNDGGRIGGGRVGELPGKPSERVAVLIPEERLHVPDAILNFHLPPWMDQMPSMDHLSSSLVGFGSLPGQRNEEGSMAILPDGVRRWVWISLVVTLDSSFPSRSMNRGTRPRRETRRKALVINQDSLFLEIL